MYSISGLEYFNLEVVQSSGVTVVVFTSEFSQTSKAYLKLLVELEASYGKAPKFYRVASDENLDITTKYGIHYFPTTLIFKAGSIIETCTSASPPKLSIKPVIDSNI